MFILRKIVRPVTIFMNNPPVLQGTRPNPPKINTTTTKPARLKPSGKENTNQTFQFTKEPEYDYYSSDNYYTDFDQYSYENNPGLYYYDEDEYIT